MKNTNLKLFLLLFSIAPLSCIASELIKFDSPHLVIENIHPRINGHYSMSAATSSCNFFFSGLINEGRQGRILAFSTKRDFIHRNTDFDTKGRVILNDSGEWTILLEDEPPGCGGATGSFVALNSQFPNRFSPFAHDHNSTLMVVTNKSTVKNGNLSQIIPPGSAVIVSKRTATKAYVRYQPANGDKAVSGWIEIRLLISPFPDDLPVVE